VIYVAHHRDEMPRCITHFLKIRSEQIEAQGKLPTDLVASE
jgi:ABC-type molybdenum transport system ATPase subunit/photorepair protein PhrA